MTADAAWNEDDQPTEYFVLSNFEKKPGLITQAPRVRNSAKQVWNPGRKCDVLGSSGVTGLVDQLSTSPLYRFRCAARAMSGHIMSSLQLGVLEAKVARARQLVIEQQRLVRTRRVDHVAKARELLTYWLHNLEAHREIILRQSRLDRAMSAGQRHAHRARSNAA